MERLNETEMIDLNRVERKPVTRHTHTLQSDLSGLGIRSDFVRGQNTELGRERERKDGAR